DVPTILASMARQLDSNRDQLNNVDNNGTHGQRMADAFPAAAYAAQNAGSTDAGDQLHAAAQAMREQGEGKAAAYYAQGLDATAEQFKGQTGISQADLGKFLQSF